MTVLLLGGTAEARALAARLDADGTRVVSSLAGRVREPRLPVGEVRVGGFGGVDGLGTYVDARRVAAVVDATHPFAAQISVNAVAACAQTGTPLLRLARPGWGDLPGAHRWHWVDTHTEAAELAAVEGVRILLTTGRKSLDRFVGPLGGRDVMVRVVDPVDIALPGSWRVLLGRGPYTLAGERVLLEDGRVEVLITKDSGGHHTRAKLDAADELGVTVVVVRRPARSGDVPNVGDVDAAVRWLRAQHLPAQQ